MYNIVSYQPAFRAACIEIFESNMPKFFAPDEAELFAGWLDHHSGENYYVLESAGRILACGGIAVNAAETQTGLTWGMVHARHHGRGIGKLFTQHRINLLKLKYPFAVCSMETSQHTAVFYKKLGFSVSQIIPNGFGEGLDKYIMQLS
jgi:GNAT superfamily N-acetyltransferase